MMAAKGALTGRLILRHISTKCLKVSGVGLGKEYQGHCSRAHSSTYQDRRQNQESFKETPVYRYCGIAIAALFSGGLLYEVKKLSNALRPLHAAGPDDPGSSSGSSSRNRFNFIADVVDQTGSAVVFIERLAKNPFTKRSIPVPISHGSGFIGDPTGLVITNAHVVGNQSTVKVRLQNGREYEGRVVEVDEGLDLAAVQINGKNLPHLELGCSSEIRPGEWVVAMGSPLNLKNTVTAGIISNIHRAGKELGLRDHEKREMEYIQTDAMINVGNSGGPLVNLDGEVIGVNSMMASAGIGFAIPVDYVKEFLQYSKQGQKDRRRQSTGQSGSSFKRRYIGITMLTLTPDIVDQLRLRDATFPDVSRGVLVHKVQCNSPADNAGMQDSDVIVRINGKDIYSTQDIFKAINAPEVQVTVRRGTKNIDLRITPEDVA